MPPELVLCGTLSPDIEVFMKIPEELFRNRFEQEYNAETGRDLIPEGADFGTYFKKCLEEASHGNAKMALFAATEYGARRDNPENLRAFRDWILKSICLGSSYARVFCLREYLREAVESGNMGSAEAYAREALLLYRDHGYIMAAETALRGLLALGDEEALARAEELLEDALKTTGAAELLLVFAQGTLDYDDGPEKISERADLLIHAADLGIREAIRLMAVYYRVHVRDLAPRVKDLIACVKRHQEDDDAGARKTLALIYSAGTFRTNPVYDFRKARLTLAEIREPDEETDRIMEMCGGRDAL